MINFTRSLLVRSVVLGSLVFVAGNVISAQTPSASPPNITGIGKYVRADAETRRKRYLREIFGYTTALKNIASAGIATWTNEPKEWRPTWNGFGKRVASNYGKDIIKYSVRYGMDEALKLDSHYIRADKASVSAKVKNAFISPFTARTVSGKRVVGVPNLVGTYAANIIAVEAWYPKRYDFADGLKSGTISLGTSVLFNLVREFIKK